MVEVGPVALVVVAVLVVLLLLLVRVEDVDFEPPQPAINAVAPPPKPTRNARRLKTLVSDPPRLAAIPPARLSNSRHCNRVGQSARRRGTGSTIAMQPVAFARHD